MDFSAPSPAPFWFVEFFKVVGYTLHLVPMGVWFAGLPIVILAAIANTKNSGLYAQRMFRQFPVFLAFGINFGIVPLLFLQTTYYKTFYTATILTAWYWIAVIPILIAGYYSLYIAAYAGHKRSRQILFGFIAAVCLTIIGLLIANGLSLMVRSDLWNGIFEKTAYYGATTGLAHNFRDTALWYRVGIVFGFALITTGVWTVFDAFWLSNEDADYQRWTTRLALVLAVLGLAVLAMIPHLPLLFGCPSSEAFKTAFPHHWAVGLYAGPIAVVLLLFGVMYKQSKGSVMCKHSVMLTALMQFLSLGYFAVVRQIGQNAGVAEFADVSQLPVAVQWDTLAAFLVVFVLGVLTIVWMLRQVARHH